jgi:hypothetical protein
MVKNLVRSDISQSSQVYPIAAGTSESIAVREVLQGSFQVSQVQAHHEIISGTNMEMNFMLPNCMKNYPKIFKDFCMNMLRNISQNQIKTSSSSTSKQDLMR